MSRQQAKHYLVHAFQAVLDATLPPLIKLNDINTDIGYLMKDEFRQDIEQVVDEIMDGVKEELTNEDMS